MNIDLTKPIRVVAGWYHTQYFSHLGPSKLEALEGTAHAALLPVHLLGVNEPDQSYYDEVAAYGRLLENAPKMLAAIKRELGPRSQTVHEYEAFERLVAAIETPLPQLIQPQSIEHHDNPRT